MRRLIGVLVLIAGTGGLAYWASATHAVRIEQQITQAATALVQDASRDVVIDVSGRDVRVAGTVASQTDRDRLVGQLFALDGVRVVEADTLALLPIASPFEVRITPGADGTLIATGVLPSEDSRAMLPNIDTSAVTLAGGVPDDRWTSALWMGVQALDGIDGGGLILSDRALTLSGSVRTPQEQTGVANVMADLPDGYRYIDALDVLDDGTPLRLDIALSDGRARATGKVPADMAFAAVTDVFGGAMVEIAQSALPADPPDWPQITGRLITALATLNSGRLNVESTTVSLAGRGTPDALARANAMLDNLPASYDVTRDLALDDDGAPVSLTIAWDGATATASGKYPAGFAPTGPLGTQVEDTGAASFLEDDGAFAANAAAGVAALGQLRSGTLTVTTQNITLSGTATSPQVGTVIDTLLTEAPVPSTVDLIYLDDGSPAAWTLTYDASSGATVEGRLPTTLSRADLAAALGSDVTGDPVTAAEDDTAGPMPDALRQVAAILPELDQLTASVDGTGAALDLVTTPGSDIDLLAAELAQNLPASVAFSIRTLDEAPQQGSTRTNAATGLDEVFLDGFWIPDLDFATTLDGCAAEADSRLGARQIGFVSGSARLDAASLRTINALAAIARPCVEADLELEVAGHTDASGDPDQNQILSQERAEVVRRALIERGVPARAITAIGFGADRSIATNDTPEGRAANRRTEIDWFERGALRDP
ncbi:OmpA family protein [Pseudooctadecabacter jejudonensis]|uniref:Outer membrane porin F n=1 Tax=Pseudooctadecabacter jejudonensis TaxID=1391910 RepID=A0A1Y5T271_9RHOB|nr:OmpA family protein [Pseudooctadecabacter jejudonensis]SLN54229.1 Outer membrane porin F precursor [Pseudooctadecabacter jejudonensis]